MQDSASWQKTRLSQNSCLTVERQPFLSGCTGDGDAGVVRRLAVTGLGVAGGVGGGEGNGWRCHLDCGWGQAVLAYTPVNPPLTTSQCTVNDTLTPG